MRSIPQNKKNNDDGILHSRDRGANVFKTHNNVQFMESKVPEMI